MKSIKTMLKIEGKLSIRDMNMCIFAIIMDCQHFFIQLLFGHIRNSIFYWCHII